MKNKSKVEALDIVSSFKITYFFSLYPFINLFWLILTFSFLYPYFDVSILKFALFSSLGLPFYLYTLAPNYDVIKQGVKFLKTRMLYFFVPKLIQKLKEKRKTLQEQVKITIDNHFENSQIKAIIKEKMSENEWVKRSFKILKKSNSFDEDKLENIMSTPADLRFDSAVLVTEFDEFSN